MSEWKTVRLGNYVKIQTGKLDANASSKDGKYPFFTCSIEPLKISTYSYDCECCLVAGNGDLNVKYYNGKFDAYQRTYIIESVDKEKLDVMFLYFFLSSYIEVLRKQSIGGVIKYIKLGNLTDALIPIPSLEKQKEICRNLIQAQKVLTENQTLLSKYDILIKSRFIEMFGDPVNNPMNWEIKPMGELLSLLTDFSSNGSYKTLDSNVIMYDEPNYALMIRTTDLESGDFSNNVKWVDEKAYNLLSKSKVFGKEIIMNKIGSAGKVYLMPELNRPVTLGRNAFLFRYKGNINSVYIYFLLTSEYGQNEIKPYIRGAVTKTITKDDARKIRIPVPPITLQNNFENFVQQIDKSKFAVQKSLEKAETLYKSLMQEYFG